MKIGLAIASASASPASFVIFRMDLKIGIKKAADLGYDGVEIALARPEEIDAPQIKDLLQKYNIGLPVMSTGRVFAEERLWFTHPDKKTRRDAVRRVKDIIEVAGQFRASVNIGRVRGDIPDNEDERKVKERFFSAITECADFAAKNGTELLLEPVNRYETNFINSVEEGIDVVDEIGRENVKLMPDVYHMNIEDASILGSLKKAGKKVAYVHFADSNRLAPGQGHLDFKSIIDVLKDIGYDGFVSVEILPEKDPDKDARMSIDYLRQFI